MRICEHGSTAIHCPQCIARHLGIDHPPRKQTFDTPKVLSNEGLREIVKEQQATITEQAAKIAELREAILSVLCDPERNPCFEGSDGDRQVIREALASTDSSNWLAE